MYVEYVEYVDYVDYVDYVLYAHTIYVSFTFSIKH